MVVRALLVIKNDLHYYQYHMYLREMTHGEPWPLTNDVLLGYSDHILHPPEFPLELSILCYLSTDPSGNDSVIRHHVASNN